MSLYFSKMRGWADEMAVAGKPLEDDDVVAYILSGLNAEYNLMIEQVTSTVDPIRLSELYAKMLSTEARLDLHAQNGPHVTVNTSMCGKGRGSRGGFHGGRGGGEGFCGGSGDVGHGGFGHDGSGRGTPRNKDFRCQLCDKFAHSVLNYWKRFDRMFTSSKSASSAVAFQGGVDSICYTDSRVTDHITGTSSP